MFQSRYIVFAFLILFVGAIVYSSLQYFFTTRPVTPSVAMIPQPADTVTVQPIDGKALFQGKCASCHAIFKDLTGPALAGVEERWKDKKELFAFIRTPEEVMRRNAYARELKKKFVVMTPSFDLTDKEIQSILDYIRRIQNNPVIY